MTTTTIQLNGMSVGSEARYCSKHVQAPFNKICMLRVVLVCKLNDNTVNERFKYQCSIYVKNTTFRAYTRYQVTRNQSSRAKRRQDSTDRKECEMRRDVA